jgi:LPS O-antigen subunit length determinant protein (WzzB/FepE family)
VDSGGIALIVVGVLAALQGIYVARKTHQSKTGETDVAADANEITEFEANIRAFDLRAQNAEKRVGALEERLEKLEAKDRQRERQLNRIRVVVQKWFAELSAAWPDAHPMPTISEEDQELLGITIPKRRSKT